MATATISISVKENFGDIEERLGAAPEIITHHMRDAVGAGASLLEDEAKFTIPKKTGATAETIQSVVEDTPNGAEASVGTDSQVAKILEDGAVPHVIVARNRRVLRFESGGEVLFRRMVHHPGVKAKHWLEEAGLVTELPIEAKFNEEFEAAMEEAFGA